MQDNITAFNSSEYDEKIRMTLPYYDDFYKEIISVIKAMGKQVSWLDVGCGTGNMAKWAIGQIDLEKFVFCDISPNMIEAVKKRFTLSDANFIVGSVLELQYSNEFDVVTAIQVNHYLNYDEREAAIKNCYQALKDEGVFITFENFAPFTEQGKELYLERWKQYQIDHGKSQDESQKHIERYGMGYFPITISKHLELMKSCGFKAVEILWVSNMQVGLLGIK